MNILMEALSKAKVHMSLNSIRAHHGLLETWGETTFERIWWTRRTFSQNFCTIGSLDLQGGKIKRIDSRGCCWPKIETENYNRAELDN